MKKFFETFVFQTQFNIHNLLNTIELHALMYFERILNTFRPEFVLQALSSWHFYMKTFEPLDRPSSDEGTGRKEVFQ